MDIRDACFDELLKIMRKDDNVLLLTADMGAWGLTEIQRHYPDRVINMGVAEQNLINVATGLALGGKKVFCYGIAAFLIYRAFDQIRVNVCGMGLPIVLIGVGAGLTYETDGYTHHAIWDGYMMENLPGMIVVNPMIEDYAREVVRLAYQSSNPVYIRLGR